MIAWHDFHFIRPYALLLIPVLVPLVYLLRWQLRQRTGWQSIIPAHLLQKITVQQQGKGAKPPFWLAVIAIVLAALSLAGPTWEKLPQPVFQLNQGRVIVMDMSLSMRATDLTPDRLTRARFKVTDLLTSLTEGETGVVAYAGDAFVISPLTSDIKNILSLLPSVSPEIMPVPGSDPLLGLTQAADLLRGAGYMQGDIVWITDDVAQEQIPDIRQFISSQPYHVHVLAVGTAEGAPIRQINGELLKGADGAIVIPKLRENALIPLARSGSGAFAKISHNDEDIRALLAAMTPSLDAQLNAEQPLQTGDSWQDMGAYISLLLLPILLYAFRRGVLLCLLVLVLLPSVPSPAHADTSSETLAWWKRPFLRADQQGEHYFEQQDYVKAQQHFRAPDWSASAAYKAGDYATAAEQFAQLEGAEARYNQGNALAKMGELDAAIQAYEAALAERPDFEQAKKNKALLEQLKQQQEQQQQSSEGQQQEQPQDAQEQQQSSDSSDSQQSSDPSEPSEPSEPQEQQDSNTSSSEEQGDQQQSQSQSQDQADQAPADESPTQAPEDSASSNDEMQEGSAQQAELSDEEREEQERLQSLLKRVPDDPAFLLKRKMQIEAQKRQRQRAPTNRTTW